jgi:Tfp pilus assembly major pilin PilA
MDTPTNDVEARYRAVVGSQKADYYVPKFLRFDQPGGSKASWHWPAFFVTFPWLIYRRMYGYALTYFFAVPVALFIVAVALMVVLGERGGTLSYAGLAILVYWVLPPVFASAVYHHHVRKRIAEVEETSPEHVLPVLEAQKPTTNAGVIAAVAIVPVVAVVGILAAIAIPAYQDYTIRAQVADGLRLTTAYKVAVAEALAIGKVPDELNSQALGLAAPATSRYVDTVTVDGTVIVVHFGGTAHPSLQGSTLTILPTRTADGDIVWICGRAAIPNGVERFSTRAVPATSVADRYLPISCRGP